MLLLLRILQKQVNPKYIEHVFNLSKFLCVMGMQVQYQAKAGVDNVPQGF